MLTRITPSFAVAYWTSAHSARFVLHTPTRSPLRRPPASIPPARRVDGLVELGVRVPQPLLAGDERVGVRNARRPSARGSGRSSRRSAAGRMRPVRRTASSSLTPCWVTSGYTVSPAMTVFRSQLLHGRAVALAGRCDSLGDVLAALGASRRPGRRAARDEGRRPRSCSTPPTRSARAARTACARPTEAAWYAVREVATESLIPGEHGGKVVLIGPRPDAGQFAEAARSALENLARTLSIEWARHGVTATMIAPGPRTTDDQLAELVCYPDLARRATISAAAGSRSGCVCAEAAEPTRAASHAQRSSSTCSRSGSLRISWYRPA